MFRSGNRRIMTFRQRVEACRYAVIQTGRLAWHAGRRRWRLVAGAFAAVALFVGGIGAWRLLRESDHFLLRRLEVLGTDRVTPDEVAAACGLEVGVTNVLFASESEVRERCEGDSRLRRVHVEFAPPDSVLVRVEEQRPAMYVATAYGLWTVNGYGEAYAPADVAGLEDLPLLVATRAPATLGAPVLREALALVRTVSAPGSPWAGQAMLLEFDPDLGFSVNAGGLRARFGFGPFPRKLERAMAALDVAAARSLAVEEVRLDNRVRPNEVTLRVAPSGGAVAAAR